MKALVARCLAGRIKDGETIGLGSGTTVEMAIDQIAQRISREGLRVIGSATSYRTALHAAEAGIEVISSVACRSVAWTFDGADEVDPMLNLVKGRGAAMLSEKILAKKSKKFVVIVSEEKLVERLCSRHPIPVEVIPDSLFLVEDELKNLGARDLQVRAAVNKYGPVVSEHNNFVIDAWFDSVTDELERQIKSITGVVESGLFIGFKPEVLVAKKDGVWSKNLVNGKVKEMLIEAR